MNSQAAASLQVAVWRGGEQGDFHDYEVPARDNQTVLDVVTWIQRRLDPSLSYRFACRVGMCGSCAMTVNGVPRWTCRTHVTRVAVDGCLRLGPLRGMPVVKDLAVDMADFFARLARARGRFRGSATREDEPAVVKPDSPARREVDAGIECIGCGICQAACDVARWRPDYLGPAALNRAWTLHRDVRDSDGLARLRAVAGDAGCHACHSQQGCTEHCPKHLNPTAGIAGLKRAIAAAALRGRL